MLHLEPSVSCESLSKPGAYIRIKARFLCIDAWDGSGVSWLADWMGKKNESCPSFDRIQSLEVIIANRDSLSWFN